MLVRVETRAPLFLTVPQFFLSSAFFCSPSRCFCHLSLAQRPVLNSSRSSDQDELFNNLVAHFVGLASTSPMSAIPL